MKKSFIKGVTRKNGVLLANTVDGMKEVVINKEKLKKSYEEMKSAHAPFRKYISEIESDYRDILMRVNKHNESVAILENVLLYDSVCNISRAVTCLNAAGRVLPSPAQKLGMNIPANLTADTWKSVEDDLKKIGNKSVEPYKPFVEKPHIPFDRIEMLLYTNPASLMELAGLVFYEPYIYMWLKEAGKIYPEYNFMAMTLFVANENYRQSADEIAFAKSNTDVFCVLAAILYDYNSLSDEQLKVALNDVLLKNRYILALPTTKRNAFVKSTKMDSIDWLLCALHIKPLIGRKISQNTKLIMDALKDTPWIRTYAEIIRNKFSATWPVVKSYLQSIGVSDSTIREVTAEEFINDELGIITSEDMEEVKKLSVEIERIENNLKNERK